VKARQLTR